MNMWSMILIPTLISLLELSDTYPPTKAIMYCATTNIIGTSMVSTSTLVANTPVGCILAALTD